MHNAKGTPPCTFIQLWDNVQTLSLSKLLPPNFLTLVKEIISLYPLFIFIECKYISLSCIHLSSLMGTATAAAVPMSRDRKRVAVSDSNHGGHYGRRDLASRLTERSQTLDFSPSTKYECDPGTGLGHP